MTHLERQLKGASSLHTAHGQLEAGQLRRSQLLEQEADGKPEVVELRNTIGTLEAKEFRLAQGISLGATLG